MGITVQELGPLGLNDLSGLSSLDDLGFSVPNPIRVIKEVAKSFGRQFKDIVTDPVGFAENIVEAFEFLACKLTTNQWISRLGQAGLIAEGVPPDVARLIAEVAKAMCSLIPIISSDADTEFKVIAVLIVLADIFVF